MLYVSSEFLFCLLIQFIPFYRCGCPSSTLIKLCPSFVYRIYLYYLKRSNVFRIPPGAFRSSISSNPRAPTCGPRSICLTNRCKQHLRSAWRSTVPAAPYYNVPPFVVLRWGLRSARRRHSSPLSSPSTKKSKDPPAPSMTPPTKLATSFLPNHKLVPFASIPRNLMPLCYN
jgi:hypothetical protein